MIFSIKHLLHTPIKSFLLFLLVLVSTVLLIFSTDIYLNSSKSIEEVKTQFHTIATVTQNPDISEIEVVSWFSFNNRNLSYTVNKYSEIIDVDTLMFDEAEYVTPPEQRPYYLAYLPEISRTWYEPVSESQGVSIIEFTPLLSAVASEPVDVMIENILFYSKGLGERETLKIGDVIRVEDISTPTPIYLEKGKTYIATISYSGAVYMQSDIATYFVEQAPYSTMYSAKSTGENSSFLSPEDIRNGNASVPIEQRVTNYSYSDPETSRIEEVGENFYLQGERGEDWLLWAELHKNYDKYFLVLPTNSFSLLPSFHNNEAYVSEGREISKEEFTAGANVCMVSEDFAKQNLLKVGDKISLPLSISLYGYLPDREKMYRLEAPGATTYQRGFSPLNSDMEVYSPFWEAEYEVVGLYKPLMPASLSSGKTELARDMFIIPIGSVKASDENNIAHYGAMNSYTSSFEIENGTILEFDAILSKNIANIDKLSISYDDNGYEEIAASLESARLTAILLFVSGTVITISIIILIVYFFIVKQKKRTAVERALGMSKKECRNSLLIGVLVLTVTATILGSALALTLNYFNAESEEVAEFETSYSLWATEQVLEYEEKQETIIFIYIVIPLVIILLVYVFSLFLIGQNIKIEPVLLLGAKWD